MRGILFIMQALFSTFIIWTMGSFILWNMKPWTYDPSQRLAAMIALIIMFIVVKSLTDPDD